MRGFHHTTINNNSNRNSDKKHDSTNNSPPVRGRRGGFLTPTTDDSSQRFKREYLCGGGSLLVPTVEGQFDDSSQDEDDEDNNDKMAAEEAGDLIFAALQNDTRTTTNTGTGVHHDTTPMCHPQQIVTPIDCTMATASDSRQQENQQTPSQMYQDASSNEPAGFRRQTFLSRTPVNDRDSTTIAPRAYSDLSSGTPSDPQQPSHALPQPSQPRGGIGSSASIVSHTATSTNSSLPSGQSSISSASSKGPAEEGGGRSKILPTPPLSRTEPVTMTSPPDAQHAHHNHHNDPPFAGYSIPEHRSMPPLPNPTNIGQSQTLTASSSQPTNLPNSSNDTVASIVSSISGYTHPVPDDTHPLPTRQEQHQQPYLPSPRTSPRFPQYKLTGAPKSELYAIYGKDPYRKILSPADYITWNDGGPPHNLRFTSIFVCPVTGETFAAGGYQVEGTHYEWKNDGLCWYKSKKMAEHAAAARAHDCLSYRTVPAGHAYPYVGNDAPYHKPDRPVLSSTQIPSPQWQQIVTAQLRAPQFDSDEELERDLFT